MSWVTMTQVIVLGMLRSMLDKCCLLGLHSWLYNAFLSCEDVLRCIEEGLVFPAARLA